MGGSVHLTTSSGDEIKACGNCRFFVAGGACQRVIGEINAHDLCDLWSYGQPQVLGSEAVPTFEKSEVAYRGALIIEGWPPKIEGEDRWAPIEPIKVPDTGYPPIRPDPAPRTEPYSSPESRKVDKLYEPYLTVLETMQVFDESKHPRDEDGKFASGGQTLVTPEKYAATKRKINTEKHRVVKGMKTSLGESYQDQWVNELENPIRSNEQLSEFKVALAKFDEVMDTDPNVARRFREFELDVEDYNKDLKTVYDNSKVLYRGTRLEEIDEYLKTGTIGGDKNNYDFVSTTLDYEEAKFFNRGIIIEYDAESTRQHGGEVANYSARPVPFKAQMEDEDRKLFKHLEAMKKPMSAKFADEQEVRLPEGTSLEKIKISRIIFNMGKLESGEAMIKGGKYREKARNKLIAKWGKKYNKLAPLKFVQKIPIIGEEGQSITYDWRALV